ncbi:thiamine diphosphokinase [Slackia exigua]|uniref:thiamine diphosphokinase n=1 Tax=Slackia exigua TaxID=84109 RepID=UPI0020066C9F|nr:thiamine diphosphokinase [Slackia exigua]MCK6139832.1 thiamine diphosphokinase [Slackia exigua]
MEQRHEGGCVRIASSGGVGSSGGICAVVGSAAFDEAFFSRHRFDYVVAADAGFASLMRAGIHPDAVVGDFDSLGFVPDVPDAVVHPARKDESDLFLACEQALAHGCGTIALLGALGGRLDQTYATLQTLVRLSHRGIRSFAAGDGECVAVLTGGAFDELFLPASLNGGFSVFSASDRSFGVDEEGASYALSSATLSNDVPLGLSNECAGAPIRISVSEGDLLVFLPSSTTFDV